MIGQTFDQIQREQVQWVAEHFPGRSASYPLLGIVEELGELVEAMATQDPDGFEDAIGDVFLYLSDYATTQDWKLSELWDNRTPYERFELDSPARLMAALGRLAKASIKAERGIRGTSAEWRERGREAAAVMLLELAWIVGENDELERIVRETWARVRARNWNRFPHDGLTR